MKKIILLMALTLSGCATTDMVYNPNGMNEQKLVKVETLREASAFSFSAKYNAYIMYVYNEKNEEVTKRNALFSNKISEIKLQPGKYLFKVECKSRNYYADTEGKFELLPSKKYQLYCDIKKGKNIFGGSADASVSLKIREIK